MHRLILLALASALAALAQLDTGSILGSVLDSSGAVVPSAKVAVQNQGTAATVDLITDGAGNFIAPVLPVGAYRLTVSAPGFKTQVLENIALRVSDRVRVTVTLEPGAVQETVTVSGAAPLVETASTTLGGVVGAQEINDLPLNGRNLTQLLGQIPGVMLLGGATAQSINGASTFRQEGGLRFLLDGGDASRVDFDALDNTYGSSRNRITRASVDAVQEFRVYTNSYSAEFGQALGGVVNLITKSGSNELHATAFEYFRNEKLDSRDYFNVPPAIKPPFRLNQFGGSLGGPLVRDRLFFFANYEGIRQRLGAIQNTFVPTEDYRRTVVPAVRPALDMLPLPNGETSPADRRLARFIRSVSNPLTEDTGAFKLDYRISAQDSLAFRYNINESLTKVFAGVARGQINTAPGRLQLSKLTYTHVFSPGVLNEAGFAFNRHHIDPRTAETEEVTNFPITGLGSGSAGVGPGLFDLLVANNSFTWLDTLSWVHGPHQLKFGGQLIKNQDNKELHFQRSVTYLTLDEFAVNSAFSVGSLGYPRMGLRNAYYQLFVQDDIQASRRLTVNLGFRYQYDSAPAESHGRIANFNPATAQLDPLGTTLLSAPKTNFDPRIGLAWTPFGSQRTVVRAGFGIFHASLNAAIAQNVPSNVFGQQSSITRQQVPALVGFPFPTITSFAVANITALPKNWQAAYTQHWNLNIQQALGQESVLQVGYLGNHSVHLSGGQNLNRLIAGTSRRPYANWGNISFQRTDLNSSYNALQTTFRRRLQRGLTMNVNYTWSHTHDFGGVAFGTATQDDTNPRDAYGNADFDVRHLIGVGYTYQVPAAPRLPGWLGGGWQINGITAIRTGLSVNITCGCDSALIGSAGSRPDRVDGVPLRPTPVSIPNAHINIAAFRRPLIAPGNFGNLGRNILKGPSAINFDFSLFKNFKLREFRAVQFRAEFYNFFNTPQFANPGANIAAPVNFGRSLSTRAALGGFGTNRQIQFALRYSF